MMMKKNILIFLMMLIIFIVSFLVLTFDLLAGEKANEILDVSVIVRGKSSDNWTSMKQGADQAASEMNVNLSFITLTEENSVSEQVFLFNREVKNGANAVLLSAADSKGMVYLVEKAAQAIPVICIESLVDSASISSYVSADNYKMGQALADEIIANGNVRKKLAVIRSENNSTTIEQRCDGLMDQLEKTNNTVYDWNFSDHSPASADTLLELIQEHEVDAIVAPDLSLLEFAAQVLQDNQIPEVSLFGIGATGKVASYLEQDVITATIVPDDFSIGYLGVKAAVDATKKIKPDPVITVGYRMINKDNMYRIENQRLLFPFVR